MMKDIMLDIETLSTDSNGVIVSISAVQFSMKTGKVGDQFAIGLNIDQQQKSGGVIDGSTVMWWLKQSQEAQAELTALHPIGVGNALDQFNEWITSLGISPNDMKMWGNGSNFDNIMVRNLYKRQGKKFVLPYWCDNDVRTLVSLFNVNIADTKFVGTKHKGIDDCLHQIRYCTRGYNGDD